MINALRLITRLSRRPARISIVEFAIADVSDISVPITGRPNDSEIRQARRRRSS